MRAAEVVAAAAPGAVGTAALAMPVAVAFALAVTLALPRCRSKRQAPRAG